LARRSRIQEVSASPSEREVALDPPARDLFRATAVGAKNGDEEALVRAAQGGSADAIERLVWRNWDDAHRTAFLIVHDAGAAEDIAQEAMLAAVRAIDRFDRRRPFRPWLHRIVVNQALDWLRAPQRRAEVSAETVHPPEHRPGPSDSAEKGLSGELIAALRALDPEQRAIVVVRHLLGYNAREIGRMLGLPSATVRTRLRRALDRLRKLLDDEEGTP
jgi:RNA polymerase sigma-70 factor, ECF subfamily